VYVLAVHTFAIVALLCSPLPTWVLLAGVPLVVAYGVENWRIHVSRRDRRSVMSAVREPDGGWALVDRAGRSWTGRLLAGSYIGIRFMVLRIGGGVFDHACLVLCVDNVGAEQMRRLRVVLRDN
jgi:hypothetical protein